MEKLEVLVTYTEPDREMSGSGTIDSMAVEVESKASRIGRKYEIGGTIDNQDVRVEIDGFTWGSDTEAVGVWGERSVRFELAFAGDNLLVTGTLGGDHIDLTVVRRLGMRFTAMGADDDRPYDLLLDGDQPRLQLTGEAQRIADAVVLVLLSAPMARSRPLTGHSPMLG